MPRCNVNGTQYDSHLEAEVHQAATGFERIPSRQKPSCFEVTVIEGYNPDFVYKGKKYDLYIEAKGRLFDRNRAVLIHMKPEEKRKVKFVLQNYLMKYKNKGKATIAQWLERHGFEWIWVKDPSLKRKIQQWKREADGES